MIPKLLPTALCLLGAASALAQSAPHPAVARIIVQERDAAAYGSGSLVDVRGEYALVITNWHVVRDATGPINVVFPSGFRSEARRLKLDEHWDLAALVIWRPPARPIPIARQAPRQGDQLTICGYGAGQYREATGRCTEYYAPEIGMPHELVELDVEARQGDSGGPILNASGEIAGVLFGAGQGTTLGSFGGRVGMFLASLSPDILTPRTPRPSGDSLQHDASPSPAMVALNAPPAAAAAIPQYDSPQPAGTAQPSGQYDAVARAQSDAFTPWAASSPTASELAESPVAAKPAAETAVGDRYANASPPTTPPTEAPATTEQSIEPATGPVVVAMTSEATAAAAPDWFDEARTIFAIVGLIFVFMQLVRVVT